MDGRADRQVAGGTGAWANGPSNGQTDGRTDAVMRRRMHGWVDGRTVRQEMLAPNYKESVVVVGVGGGVGWGAGLEQRGAKGGEKWRKDKAGREGGGEKVSNRGTDEQRSGRKGESRLGGDDRWDGRIVCTV